MASRGSCTARGPELVSLPLASPARSAVITGSGVVSPLGYGLAAFWDGLVAGRSAIARIRRFRTDDLDPATAAEVAGGDAADPDRAGGFALGATTEALAAARLRPDVLDPARIGVVLGTTLGGMEIFEAWDRADAAGDEPPPQLDRVPYFAPAMRVAAAIGARGPVMTTQLACASGTQAVAMAADWVRAGRADVVLAGGSDLLCRFVVAGFNSLRATADGGAAVRSRPPRTRAGRGRRDAGDRGGGARGAARCARHCARARHRGGRRCGAHDGARS